MKEKLDEIARKWDTSGAVLVLRENTFIHENVYGFSDRENEKKMNEQDTFALSLRSPLFLGLALLALLDRDLIHLDDHLNKYIPEYPYSDQITINNLLFHTSGIMDYFYSHTMLELQKDEDYKILTVEEKFRTERILYEQNVSFEEVFDIVKDKPLDFLPGQRDYDWSLTNIIFLTEVVERISGMNIFTFLKKEAFDPWGMNHICLGYHPTTVSYSCMKDTVLVRLPYCEQLDHAVTVTIADIKALMKALMNRKTFKKAAWNKALTFNKEGFNMLAENANGICCATATLLGYEMNLYFDWRIQLSYVHLSNEMQILIRSEDEIRYFRKEMRELIEMETTHPKFTKLMPYCEQTAWGAMDLKVDETQRSYVFDAKTTLCFALIKPRVRKTYVLVEGMRAVGILVLSVDRKNSYYHIDVILIDKRYQHRGFGKIMLQKAIKILKAKGAKQIEIGVNRNNTAAYKLYLGAGFKATTIYDQGMALQLDL
ncbi:MAG: GNAT family N-acetyltransferase [Bacilli bacterium]|jgi:CubicO group peptidase (beta-lactamase class C family)/GNAT superfamily N-acetyltransferase|nr:GNAT family N-acetyltransferase [Bacilli bacterium]